MLNRIHIEAIRSLVESRRQDPFCQRRYARNVVDPPHSFSRKDFWKWMIVCICTSVQRNGPNSRVSLFVREEPFPLRLEVCVVNERLRQLSEDVIRSRGLRFGPTLAAQVEANMAWLNNGGWARVERQFGTLASFSKNIGSPQQRIAAERTAARLVMGRRGGLAGFGPKQARNLWQCLGVTQYEIPLDSRVSNWVNALPSSFGMDTSRLYSGVRYYEFKMTQVQALCDAAGVLPCEFDASVFSNADDEPWPEEDTVL